MSQSPIVYVQAEVNGKVNQPQSWVYHPQAGWQASGFNPASSSVYVSPTLTSGR